MRVEIASGQLVADFPVEQGVQVSNNRKCHAWIMTLQRRKNVRGSTGSQLTQRSIKAPPLPRWRPSETNDLIPQKTNDADSRSNKMVPGRDKARLCRACQTAMPQTVTCQLHHQFIIIISSSSANMAGRCRLVAAAAGVIIVVTSVPMIPSTMARLRSRCTDLRRRSCLRLERLRQR